MIHASRASIYIYVVKIRIEIKTGVSYYYAG